ncbi:hypothetical protein RhiirC2_803959, partial [Rhizophagus irregularis]
MSGQQKQGPSGQTSKNTESGGRSFMTLSHEGNIVYGANNNKQQSPSLQDEEGFTPVLGRRQSLKIKQEDQQRRSNYSMNLRSSRHTTPEVVIERIDYDRSAYQQAALESNNTLKNNSAKKPQPAPKLTPITFQLVDQQNAKNDVTIDNEME